MKKSTHLKYKIVLINTFRNKQQTLQIRKKISKITKEHTQTYETRARNTQTDIRNTRHKHTDIRNKTDTQTYKSKDRYTVSLHKQISILIGIFHTQFDKIIALKSEQWGLLNRQGQVNQSS